MRLTNTILMMTVLSAVGAAQANFDYDVADISLLQAKEIQTELNISASQRAELNKHADWFNAENRKLMQEAQKLAQEGKQPTKSLIDRGTKLGNDMKKKVMGVLSKWQTQRLREISLQSVGYLALMDATVAKRVGLSDAQLKNIRTQFEASGKKANDAQQSAFKPVLDKYKDRKANTDAERQKLQADFDKDMAAAQKKVEPQLKKFRDDWIAYVKKTMTAQQTKAFTDLQGKTFKV